MLRFAEREVAALRGRNLKFHTKAVIAALAWVIAWALSTHLAGAQVAASQIASSGAIEVDDKTFQRIEALIRSGEFDEAERRLESQLSDTSALRASAYFRMGRLYFEHQQWARAATFLQKSLRLDNHNDQTHLLLGLAWRELKKPEEAEGELLEAAKQNPRSDVNAYMAGHQLLITSKFASALPYLYRAVELNPQRADAFRALGMTLARLGNYGLAESYYRKAIEMGGGDNALDLAACQDLAFLLLLGHDQQKLAEGLKYAQRAAHLQPSSAAAHYLVGKALLKLGRLQEAIPALKQAAKLDPQDTKPHFLLAQAFDRLGQEQEAKKERELLAKIKRRSDAPGVATGTPLAPYPQ